MGMYGSALVFYGVQLDVESSYENHVRTIYDKHTGDPSEEEYTVRKETAYGKDFGELQKEIESSETIEGIKDYEEVMACGLVVDSLGDDYCESKTISPPSSEEMTKTKEELKALGIDEEPTLRLLRVYR